MKIIITLSLALLSTYAFAQTNQTQVSSPVVEPTITTVDKINSYPVNNAPGRVSATPMFKSPTDPVTNRPLEPIKKLPHGIVIIQPGSPMPIYDGNPIYHHKNINAIKNAPGKMQDTGENQVPQTK